MTRTPGAPAPFYQTLSEGPASGHAVWRKTDDGVLIRVGFWPLDGAAGTIFVFNGRTEYIEKYGRLATDLTDAGYAIATLDWRGQGLSDRLTVDPRLGHVEHFLDYQKDVAEVLEAAREAGMPEPYYLIAHSMGGTIGLRAILDGLPVRRAVFSAPMWGIYFTPALRPLANILPKVVSRLELSLKYAPGTGPEAFPLKTAFDENMLTTDPDHYEYFRRQATAHEEFAEGGPSLHWLAESLTEMLELARCPRPRLPVKTYLGTREEIVDSAAIRKLHDDWPSAELIIVDGAKHEVIMERPELRAIFLDGTCRFFDADRATESEN